MNSLVGFRREIWRGIPLRTLALPSRHHLMIDRSTPDGRGIGRTTGLPGMGLKEHLAGLENPGEKWECF
jgi:hypothetical protein